MRRTASAMLVRLAALIVALVVAAPGVVAAPAPSRSSTVDSVAAGRARTGSLEKKSGTLEARGQVRAKAFDGSKTKVHGAGPLAKTRLGVERSTTSSKQPKVGTTLRVASVQSTQTTRGDISSIMLNGLHNGEVGPAIHPGDPYVGVGPDHVVETVNVAMKIQRRQGELTASNFQFPIADLFLLPSSSDNPGGPVTYNSDPRVIYDSLHGRWFASELSYDCVQKYNPSDPSEEAAQFGHGYLDVAVSETADPNGLWTVYSFGKNDFLFDYPGLGTTSDKVLLSANVYAFNSTNSVDTCGFSPALQTSIVVGLDWGELQAGGDVRYQLLDEFDGLDTMFSIRPSIQIPGTATTGYAVAELADGSIHEGDVQILRITGNPTSGSMGVLIENASVTAGLDKFDAPPNPRQPGGDVLAGAVDERPTDALYQPGRLVFVATTACAPTGDSVIRDCVRVGEVNPIASPTISTQTQDFLVAANGLDRFFGGIAMSYNGTLHVTFSESSATQYISSRTVYQVPGDGANHVSIVDQLNEGTATYTVDRWGDYLGVAADPQAPGAVWTATNYSTGATTWATSIWRLDTDAGATYHPIAPQRVLDTRNGTGLTNRFVANSPRTFQITNGGTIPHAAVAITGNVTVTQQTASGYVAVTPRATNSPSTSTLNFPVADNRANNVTLPLGPNGTIAAVYRSSSGQRTHLIFDVTGYFVPGSAEAGYNTVTPARILDTRTGVGLAGKFRAGIPRAFQVRNRGGVPNDPTIVAVTGNVTVTRQTSGGFIALTPTNSGTPSTSNLNFPVGDNRANGVSVRLGDDGRLWAVYGGAPSGATTDLVFDVTGYYKSGGSGLKFYALNPGRIMDTRAGAVLSGLSGAFNGTGSPSLATRTLDTAGHQGVPLAAAAVTGNFTVTRATRAGFFSIRKLASDPETSTINFPAGDNRANGVTVPVNVAGDLVLRYNASGGTSHAILDISGYFAP